MQSALNTMHNKGINTTPMGALIGCDGRRVAEGQVLRAVQEGMDRLDLAQLRDGVAQHITKQRKEQNGKLVLMQLTSEPATGGSGKLFPEYKGPFQVRTVVLNDRYNLEDTREGVKRFRTVVAADRIMPWIAIQRDDHGSSD